ncbi:MAG TPA: flavin reductase family protein [Burkholderiaceae bacterium]|jgi:3-hydroxy-9,10-secoandrosta-1,3,5(10)-triene-9,17-dione monooxygenase reductase component|nr:flavin reductase family protein [Burkholderiaceae bacterium]
MSSRDEADGRAQVPPEAPEDPTDGAEGARDGDSVTPPAVVSAPAPDLAPDELRRALGRFVTGVTIVTCRDATGEPVGLTANSFNALSLDPPLVLWALRRLSSSIESFTSATHFTINVLAEGQIELSRHFARPSQAKFEAGRWRDGQGGAPMLEGCVATFECRRRSHHEAGDHVLFIGEVERIGGSAAAPLVYHGGHYRALGDPL